MDRTKQTLFKLFEALMDGICIFLAYYMAYWIQFSLLHNLAAIDRETYFYPLRFMIPLILFIYMCFGLYKVMTVTGRVHEAFQVLKANVIADILLLAALFILSSTTHSSSWNAVMFSRLLIILFGVFSVMLTVGWRNMVRLILLRLRKTKFNRRNVLIVGFGRAANDYIDRVSSHQQWGLDVYGILDDINQPDTDYRGFKVLGPIANLVDILATNEIQEIVICLRLEEYGKLESIVRACEKSGVHTIFVPDYSEIISTKPYTEDLLGLPVVHIRHVPLMEIGNTLLKRTEDIIGSVLSIIIFSPIMIGTAIAVKLSSPGPVIFRQERVGLHNKPFNMYKFRSMAEQKPDEEVDKWTKKGDPRVTKVGRFIRKTSIDELPQLFNVLKGDMSLVGPRPERPFFVEKFKEEIPRYMVKHQVRPGMTGWAQVNGLRGDTSIRKRIEFDLYYIENWTPLFDIRILFLTVFRGFVNKNAY